jgi:hypothetical protein
MSRCHLVFYFAGQRWCPGCWVMVFLMLGDGVFWCCVMMFVVLGNGVLGVG